MKKTMVRIVAALLVAMLALTLLPVGAFAVTVDVYSEYYTNTKKPTVEDYGHNWEFYQSYTPQTGSVVTIKTSNYDSFVTIEGYHYDLKGIVDPTKTDFSKGSNHIVYTNSLTITDANAHLHNYEVWLSYVPHSHRLSKWYSDGTTHWKECLTCKKYHVSGRDKFMYQNWCQDGDEDGICNVCGGDVPYHDVTVVEEEGGKIIVNRDNACHRMKITADVEPAEGYKLKKLHFTKIRDDGSEQEITRYKKNGQFWTYMPTYELEVSAEFVKVKK